MTRRAFLHVGSPKTGTTYLQSVLWASRPALRRQGVLLPLTLRDHFGLSLVLRDAVDPDTDDVDAEELLASLARAVAGSDHDVLLSHELLSTATPDGVRRLLDLLAGFEVHVVVTARDWQRQLPAEWQQHVKTRFEQTYEEFLAQVREDQRHPSWVRQDFAGVAALWGDGLRPERVHVVTVPPPGSPPEVLLERFCSVLGVDPATLTAESPKANPSLTYEGAELLRRVNLALGDRLPKPRSGYNRVARFWFAENVLSTTDGTRLTLPAAHQQWCHDASTAQVRALAQAGYDVVGDLADLVAALEPTGGPVPHADDGVLLDVALQGVAGALVQRLEDLRTIDRLRRELRAARAASTSAPPGPPGTNPAPDRGGLVRRVRSRLPGSRG